MCDEADIKAKVGCIYGRSNILLRKFYFCSERVKNRLFSSYCSNLSICVICGLTIGSRPCRVSLFHTNAFRMIVGPT